MATLRALEKFLGRPAPAERFREASLSNGGPFYPPAYFLKHFNISPDLLRKEKQRRGIRAIRPKPHVARFHYSLPDAQRLWPDRFTGADRRQP
jgi:hypothetical protein